LEISFELRVFMDYLIGTALEEKPEKERR